MFWVQSVLLEPPLPLWAVPKDTELVFGPWLERGSVKTLNTHRGNPCSLQGSLQDTSPASCTAPGKCQSSSAFLSRVSALEVPSPPCSHWAEYTQHLQNHWITFLQLLYSRAKGKEAPSSQTSPCKMPARWFSYSVWRSWKQHQKSVRSKSWSSKITYWAFVFLI